MNWKKEAYQLSLNGYNARQISEKLKDVQELKNYDDENRYQKIRTYIKYERKRQGRKRDCTGKEIKTINKETTKYQNGITSFEIERELLQGEEITPVSIMTAKGLDPKVWEVVSYCTNVWQQQTKDGTTINLCQSKLSVKPIQQAITLDDIDNYFKNLKIDNLLPKIKAKNKCGEEIAEIMLPDLHIGLLSDLKETGKNNDLETIQKNYYTCIDEIKEELKQLSIKKIYLVTLGDLLHIDNDKNTTANGTLQNADGRISKIVEVAENMLISSILSLGEIAPIEIIYISGNHDRTLSYMLMRSIYRAFEKDKNVIVDTEPNPHKSRLYFDTLVGYCHGDLPKKNIANNILRTSQKMDKPIKRIEVHSGHFHSEQSYETVGGVVVKHIPSICGSSFWEHQQGYTSYKTLMCNIYNASGLSKTIYSNLN